MQPSFRNKVVILADRRKLEGELTVPADASGVIAFAHGSGSSRHSPRNRFAIPRATHLFEEPGALDEVARHACRWFVWRLSAAGAHAAGG